MLAPFFQALGHRPHLGVQYVFNSWLINVLAILPSLYVILLLNRYVARGMEATLYTLTTGVVVFIFMEMLVRRFRLRQAHAMMLALQRRYRDRVEVTLRHTRLVNLDALPAGSRQQIASSLDTIHSCYQAHNLDVLVDLPFSLLFVLAVYLLRPELGMIVMLAVLLALLIVLAGGRRQLRNQQAITQIQREQSQLIMNVSDIERQQVFGGEELLSGRWRTRAGALRELRSRQVGHQNRVQTLVRGLMYLMMVAVVARAAQLTLSGEMSFAVLLGVNMLASRAMAAVMALGGILTNLLSGQQAIEELNPLLTVERADSGTLRPPGFSGRLELSDLVFQYPKAPSPILEGLNLKLESGEILVVTGVNGAGKTTLTRLLVGLWPPGRGQVLADGVDIRQFDPAWWREQITYLPQEPVFFDGTLADNLRCLSSNADDAELLALLERVGLKEYINRHPLGLAQPIEAGGRQLSLGIRRRLALARALTTHGRLVILDEPTEGLDNAGAEMMGEVISELFDHGATLVLLSNSVTMKVVNGWHLDLNRKPVPSLTRLGAELGKVS